MSTQEKPILLVRNSANCSPVIHIVIGKLNIRGLWNVDFSHIEGISFPIDWICQIDGNACSLAKIIVNLLHKTKTPMRISAIIWEESIEALSLEDVHNMVTIMQDALRDHSQHKLALPECHMVSKDHELYDKVQSINQILALLNEKQGYAKYPLYKSVMTNVPGQKGLKVRLTKWKNGAGLGNQLTANARFNFVKFIRKFHAHGFKEENPKVPVKRDMTEFINFVNSHQFMIETDKPAPLNNNFQNLDSTKNHDVWTDVGRSVTKTGGEQISVTVRTSQALNLHLDHNRIVYRQIDENLFKAQQEKQKQADSTQKEKQKQALDLLEKNVDKMLSRNEKLNILLEKQ